MCNAPAYPNRGRGGFVPREEEDFGDGGAYPEIHVAQYPLGMGRKDKVRHTHERRALESPVFRCIQEGAGGKGSKAVALRVGADGKVDFGAIVKQGKNRDMVVYSRYEDMIQKVKHAHTRRAQCLSAPPCFQWP